MPAERTGVPRKYLLAAAAALCLILGIVLFRALSSRTRALPTSVSFSADAFRALGPDGQVLWTHHFSAPLDPAAADVPDLSHLSQLTRIADLRGDGGREVLVDAPLRPGPNPQDRDRFEIDCFSSTGALLWSYVPHETLRFGDREMSGSWYSFDMMVSGQGYAHSIFAAFGDTEWGNSFVVKIDPATGRGDLRFVNTGNIHSLNEMRTSRGTYLLIGGFNNEFDGGSLAVVNENQAFAASPQTSGTRHKCLSCPPGDPDYYFVFPRSELNRRGGLYENTVKEIYIEGSSFEVRKREVQSQHFDTFYLIEAEPKFDLVSLRFDSTYDKMHEDLQKSGQLDHSLADCPERVHPQPIRVWTPSEHWKEWNVRRVQ